MERGRTEDWREEVWEEWENRSEEQGRVREEEEEDEGWEEERGREDRSDCWEE